MTPFEEEFDDKFIKDRGPEVFSYDDALSEPPAKAAPDDEPFIKDRGPQVFTENDDASPEAPAETPPSAAGASFSDDSGVVKNDAAADTANAKPAIVQTDSATVARPAPKADDDYIAALRKIALEPGDIGGPSDAAREAIMQAKRRDRQKNYSDDISNALFAAVTRSGHLPAGADSHSEEQSEMAMQQREQAAKQGAAGRQSAAQLALAKALQDRIPKEDSPSLAMEREAIARHYDNLTAKDQAELERRTKEDERKAAEASAKEAAGAVQKELENKSLEQQRAVLGKHPGLKALGVTPDQINQMDRKALEDTAALLDKKGLRSAPAAPAKAFHSIEDVTDPSDAAMVKGLLDHTLGVEDIPARGNNRVRLMAMAKQIDPNFNTVAHDVYKHVETQQSTDEQLRRFPVLEAHLETAERAIPKNMDSQTLNKVANAWKTGTGDPSLVQFTTASNLAADELGKVLGIGTEGGRQQLEHIFNNIQSEAQLRSAFKTVRELAAAGRKSFETQRNKYAPKSAQTNGGDGGPVKMKFPDGSIHDVSPEDVELAGKKGGVPVGG